MIPNNRLQTLPHHKYDVGGFDILKLSAIYGANGAGKSNLVKALFLLREFLIREKHFSEINDSGFKLHKKGFHPKILAVEFIQEKKVFYYAIEFDKNVIKTEELYLSGLGKEKDKLLFERKTSPDNITTIRFLEEFEKDQRSQVLKSVLLEEFVKPTEPILRLLSKRDNEFLKDVKKAFDWFSNTLQVITPDSKPVALANRIENDPDFRTFAERMMCSFNLGVKSLDSEKKEIHKFFGKDDDDVINRIIQNVEESPVKMAHIRLSGNNESLIVKEDNEFWVKTLKINHSIDGSENSIAFDLGDESDGTIRLLDFLPVFRDVVSENDVFVIDEIERSMHPLLIKELIRKFSDDPETRGQLIFTTHESNLLDQQVFRKDEIWFMEKDKRGMTDLYSLSDFKEHNTIDIRKGYLNGRYGSIPFLANLQDLNWHKYDSHQ